MRDYPGFSGSAKDDAAGLAISNRMTTQINGKSQAIRNANDGISLVHAVMGRATSFANITDWFKEGSAEFIHGADERLSSDIARLGVDGVMAASGSIASSEGCSAAYAATRYLHAEIKASGGNGIKDIMGYLASNAGEGVRLVDSALRYIDSRRAARALPMRILLPRQPNSPRCRSCSNRASRS